MLSGTLVSTVSARSFPRVGQRVGQQNGSSQNLHYNKQSTMLYS